MMMLNIIESDDGGIIVLSMLNNDEYYPSC